MTAALGTTSHVLAAAARRTAPHLLAAAARRTPFHVRAPRPNTIRTIQGDHR
jgi:hypothetical protein